jgi:pullulanase/glycogen debranching enzyme
LIAEEWDAAGLYQVGSFIGDSWKEWNGRFPDDVRSFFRGEERSVTRFADRLLGSPEIYGHKKREAEQSVNVRRQNLFFHLIFNACWEPLDFELPPAGNGGGNLWRQRIDTSLDSPNDIVEWQTAPSISSHTYRTGARSVAVLFADRMNKSEYRSVIAPLRNSRFGPRFGKTSCAKLAFTIAGAR